MEDVSKKNSVGNIEAFTGTHDGTPIRRQIDRTRFPELGRNSSAKTNCSIIAKILEILRRFSVNIMTLFSAYRSFKVIIFGEKSCDTSAIKFKNIATFLQFVFVAIFGIAILK